MQTHDFILINADTDSITIGKQNGESFSEEERESLLKEINEIMPEKINFSDDGYFQKFIVLKAKNYITLQNGKVKTKGSYLKSSKTEKGLKEFMNDIINCLLFDHPNNLIHIYHKYIIEVFNVKNISRWCSRKTITKAVLNPERTTEKKILDSLKGQKVQMGDKIYVYFAKDESLQLMENWENDHDPQILLAKLYKTLVIFNNVININDFPKYHLKNKKIKEQLNTILNDKNIV